MIELINTNGVAFAAAFWWASFVLACVIVTVRGFFQ